MMKVALGQFAVSREWQENADTCLDLMQRAAEGAQICWCCRKRYWRAIMPILT